MNDIYNKLLNADYDTLGDEQYRQVCMEASGALEGWGLPKAEWCALKKLLDVKEDLIPLRPYEQKIDRKLTDEQIEDIYDRYYARKWSR